MEIILHVCYELSIFIIFAILITYLFRKYLLPSLYAYIQKIKQHKRNLENQKKLTCLTIDKVEASIIKQDQFLEALEKKIEKWNKERVQDCENKSEKSQAIIKKLEKQRQNQRQYLHTEKVRLEVLPEAIKLAEAEFIELSKKDGTEVFTNLLVELERIASK